MTTSAIPRSSGVLLHPTSLPSPFGVGDLGPMAYRWVETLSAMGQTWWQILPLGPCGAGNSPYQAFSAFAGNITLLSPELLEREGLVEASFWAGQRFPDHEVNYELVTPFKEALLGEAWRNFRAGRAGHLSGDFAAFNRREASWLDEFTLYTAIRESLGGLALPEWPRELLVRSPIALSVISKKLHEEIQKHKFGQFLFDRQWSTLKQFAAERAVRILGDAPIFVAPDSADVWAQPELFLLDADRKPTFVAGVPPDYFSADGQHWGNPIYNWKRLAETGYAWWVARVLHQLKQVDLIRFDHFRGFVQAWHIPRGEQTARNGQWVDGPGTFLFERLRQEIGGLPIIAEDLGLITPDVILVRDHLGLPGMRVIQFALNGPDDLHWPHNYVTNCASYTGTHDNETVNGWYNHLPESDRHYLSLTLGRPIGDPAWDLIQFAWSSSASLAVAPLQDLLSLGNEARMNTPGIATGNWCWRFRLDQFRPELIDRLRNLTTLYNRAAKPRPE